MEGGRVWKICRDEGARDSDVACKRTQGRPIFNSWGGEDRTQGDKCRPFTKPRVTAGG